MKKIFIFSLIAFLVATILTGTVFHALWRDDRAVNTVVGEDSARNYLLAGVDEAGSNTDMLMIVSVKEKGSTLSFLQIPRDTYLKTDLYEGKINQIYSLYLSKYGQKNAAERFLKTISSVFDLPINGYAIFHMDAVSEAVDALGGVPLFLDEDFVYTDEKTGKETRIEKGTSVLRGAEACHYIRHRAGYAEGDLGRLDAQLRFFSAAFTELTKLKNPVSYLRLYKKISPLLLTNLGEKDIISLATAFIKNRKSDNVRLMRLPGEATRGKSGSWYYVANQKEAERLLSTFFAIYSFDRDGRFVRADRENFKNIYDDRLYKAQVYTLAEAAKIKVIKK